MSVKKGVIMNGVGFCVKKMSCDILTHDWHGRNICTFTALPIWRPNMQVCGISDIFCCSISKVSADLYFRLNLEESTKVCKFALQILIAHSWIFCIVLWWRFWSDEYSGGLVRLMQGLHGEWLPCPTSPTVTHTKTPRREGNTSSKVHFLIAKILSDLREQRTAPGFAEIEIDSEGGRSCFRQFWAFSKLK